MSFLSFNVKISCIGGDNLKRFRWMAIIVAMLMVCAGCSEKEKQPTPTDVTKQFLTAIQKQDETALKTSSQWNLASMKSLQMQDEDYIDGIDHELQKAAHDTMYGFQFTIKKETIKDKNAQVAIILKTKDIRNAVKKGMKEAEKKVEKLSKDKNFSDQKAQQEILTTLYTYIRDSKEEKEQTVTTVSYTHLTLPTILLV